VPEETDNNKDEDGVVRERHHLEILHWNSLTVIVTHGWDRGKYHRDAVEEEWNMAEARKSSIAPKIARWSFIIVDYSSPDSEDTV
jgi:hypothetical protein